MPKDVALLIEEQLHNRLSLVVEHYSTLVYRDVHVNKKGVSYVRIRCQTDNIDLSAEGHISLGYNMVNTGVVL